MCLFIAAVALAAAGVYLYRKHTRTNPPASGGGGLKDGDDVVSR